MSLPRRREAHSVAADALLRHASGGQQQPLGPISKCMEPVSGYAIFEDASKQRIEEHSQSVEKRLGKVYKPLMALLLRPGDSYTADKAMIRILACPLWQVSWLLSAVMSHVPQSVTKVC